MDRERWQRVSDVFQAVADLEGKALARALDEQCGEDHDLRREVETLLAAESDAASWLAGLTARAGIPNPEAETVLNAPGRRIGAWRLVRQIGRGGMGVVYLAERADGQFEMRAALKALPVGLVTPGAVARFERERGILAGLDHPNIARLVDGGVTPEGTPFYVMEYVEGLPLHRYCDEHDPPLDRRLRLFERIAGAVAYAHRHLVIHRDIKPANVQVTGHGKPKLLDFGVAKLLDAEGDPAGTATQLGQRRMTPAYTAPELIRGEPATTACDVYSLGVVLYELLAGTPPFEPGFFDQPGWTDRVAEYRPPPPSAAAPDPAVRQRLKGDLDNIAAMAMHPDPARRYATVNALIRDLERYRKNLPVDARPDTAAYRVNRFLRRHAVGVALTGLAVASLVLGTGLALWQAELARTEAERAHSQAQRAILVRDFLQAVFVSTDPADGTMPNALDLLNEGARRARKEISGEDPFAAADILLLTGNSRLELNQLDSAESDLRDALTLLQEVDGDTSRELSRIHWNLGRFHKIRGPVERAVKHYSEAVRLMEQWPAPAEEQLRAKSSLGSALMEARDLEKAETFIREVLEEMPSAGLEVSRLHMDTLNYLSTIINLTGRNPEKQLPIHEKRFEIARQLYGENNGWYAYTLADAVPTYRKLGLLEDATELAIRAEETAKRIYREPHLVKAVAICNYAAVLLQAGRLDEALERYNKSIRIDSALDRNDLHAESCRRDRAYIRAAQGDFQDARADLDYSREMLASRDHLDSSQWLANCGLKVSVLLRMGRVQQAGETLGECEKSEAAKEKERPLEYQQALAELHFFRGDFRRSARLLTAMRDKYTPEPASREWMRPWMLSLLVSRESGQPDTADLVQTLAEYRTDSTIARCMDEVDTSGKPCLALP